MKRILDIRVPNNELLLLTGLGNLTNHHIYLQVPEVCRNESMTQMVRFLKETYRITFLS